MSNELYGRSMAILLAPRGTEQVEFEQPRKAIEEAGGSLEVLGIETGEAYTVNGDLDPGERFLVDRAIADASPEDYDGVVVPGGTVGADTLRANAAVVAFVRDVVARGKPLAVICHGAWLLVEADVVRDRVLTSFPSLKTDILNAGGTWVDEEVVIDEGLVTSRSPDDLPAFCSHLVKEFANGKREPLARSA